jgi:hypothetical protein
MKNSPGGRLVWNHSTHIPGLIPILERLCYEPGVKTITPGVISSVRAHSAKMNLKVSVPIRGGFKLIARQGKTVQEVFVITNLEREPLETAILKAMRVE